MDYKSKIILIFGPTASGKSNFAVNLAKKVKGEIINADSMQVYKEIKILNASPPKALKLKIRHHLYSFVSVHKNFSTGKWLENSIKKINEIILKKKIPIVVGGTGLYFKALTDGLVKIPKIPKSVRIRLIKKQKNIGQEKFYKDLLRIDPYIKNKINKNDIQRTIRAYEVKIFTKKSIFKWFDQTIPKFNQNQFLKIYLEISKEELLNNISKRVNKMFKEGAIKEVKKFKKLKVKKELSSNKIIGIKEIDDLLIETSNLAETKEKISIKTRQYAKRQSTWSRGHMGDWIRIPNNETKKFIKNLNSAS